MTVSDPVREMHLPVSEIREETPDVKTFRLDVSSYGPFSFLPGQFVILTTKAWNPKKERMSTVNRAFSISSPPTEEDSIEIAAKYYENGKISPWLHREVHVGDVLSVKGPDGEFIFREGETNRLVLIAGGIGIAPFRSMIYYIVQKGLPVDIHLLYSARTPQDFVYGREFDDLARQHPQFHCLYTVTRPGSDGSGGVPWTGRVGRVDEAVVREHVSRPGTLFYICGPDAMIDEMCQTLLRMGVAKDAIRFERW